MLSKTSGISFGKRVGVTVLAGVPGIVALIGYIYLTTPPTTAPAGLSLPLIAILSAVNPLLLLGVACLLVAYAAPKVGLRSHLINRIETGDRIWRHLREEAKLTFVIGILGGILIIILDAVMLPFTAQDLPQSVIGATRPTVMSVLEYAPVRFLYGE